MFNHGKTRIGTDVKDKRRKGERRVSHKAAKDTEVFATPARQFVRRG